VISGTQAMDKPLGRPRGPSRIAIGATAAGGLLLAGLLLALPAMRRWARAERVVEAARVRIGEVVRGDLERDVSAQGKIVAALHPTLFSPAQGIVALEVRAGTEVKKGRVLARIESPEMASRLQQERSSLLALRSDLGRQKIAARQAEVRNRQAVDVLTVRLAAARRALERARALFEQGLLNRTDFEKAQDDVQVAELELKNAEATARLEKETLDFEVGSRALQVQRQESIVAEVQRKVDELTLRAPFDGVVATMSVQNRDAVAPNQAILTVVNLDAFEVEFEIPENHAADVAHGTKAEVFYEGRVYPGHVTAVSPEIKDSQVKGTLVFDGDPPANLRQSQRVSARFILERREEVLKLPRGPFLESGGGRQAYVVEGGVAVKRDIEVGVVSIADVEVVRGLREGERVVISETSAFEGARTVLIRE
jgi:HlyD family secretion protein